MKTGEKIIAKYSVKTINPTFSNLIKCIIGPARSITFGENTRFVNFYINNSTPRIVLVPESTILHIAKA